MAITQHGDYVYGKIDYSGLSTDTKPTDKTVKTEAIFYELDTKLYWIYNSENINPATDDGWWEYSHMNIYTIALPAQ